MRQTGGIFSGTKFVVKYWRAKHENRKCCPQHGALHPVFAGLAFSAATIAVSETFLLRAVESWYPAWGYVVARGSYSCKVQIGRKPISERRSMNINLSSSKTPMVAFRKKVLNPKNALVQDLFTECNNRHFWLSWLDPSDPVLHTHRKLMISFHPINNKWPGYIGFSLFMVSVVGNGALLARTTLSEWEWRTCLTTFSPKLYKSIERLRKSQSFKVLKHCVQFWWKFSVILPVKKFYCWLGRV
jgi:hypothetical protein